MTNIQSKVIGVRELRGNLSAILARVEAGESLDIMRRGRKIAVLSAPVVDDEHWVPSADPSSPNFRRPGALKGKMWIADDFNDPDPELEAMMEADIFPADE